MPETAFADMPLPSSAFTPLEDRVVVRVSGPGTDKFLHGQFSQSLDEVTESHSPRAAACTPKGRAYGLTRLVRHGDDVLLTFPNDLTDDILARLQKYLMLFRGTTMTIASDARLIGVLGHALANQLNQDASNNLTAPGDSISIDSHHLIRTEDTAEGLARYEFWQMGPLSPEQADIFSETGRTQPANWNASEIAAGIAELSNASQEAFVPQMLNWQHVDGVHFKKGCYTGQEVIARMHFLGQLKKSLYRLHVDSVTTPLHSGTTVHCGDKAVGEVVNSVQYADGHAEVLAVVRHDVEFDKLLITNSAKPLTRLPLPYPVPEQQPDT